MKTTKITQKVNNKNLLSIASIIECEKKRLTIKSNDLESSFEAINLL